MKLSKQDFRNHLDTMIAQNNLKQAQMWVEHGTLIYVNFEELQDLYEEEYRDIVEKR